MRTYRCLSTTLLSLAVCEARAEETISTEGHEIIGLDHDGVVDLYGWRDGPAFWIELPGIARFCFRTASDPVVAVPEPSADSDEIVDAYLATALPMAAHAVLGYEAVHASAVVTPTGVIAFCGTTEAGKSTFAYGFSTRGHRQWADDAVAFACTPNQPLTSLALPFRIKLRPESAEFFHVEADALSRQLDLDGHEWRTAPLAGICILSPLAPHESSSTAAEITQIPPAEAVLEVLPHAFRFRPQSNERRRQMLASYLELVAAAPIFRVRFVKDLDRLPEVFDSIEATLAAPAE